MLTSVSLFMPWVVQNHLLLGIPAQMAITYDDQLFESMEATITAATAPELVSKATLSDDAQFLLRQWMDEDKEAHLHINRTLECLIDVYDLAGVPGLFLTEAQQARMWDTVKQLLAHYS